jgi:hypothetical protein
VKHALTGMNVEVSAAPPVLAKTANQTLDFASITTVMEQQFPVQHFLKNFLKEDLLKDKEDLLNKKPQKKKAQNLAHVHVKMLNFAIMMVEQTLDYVNHAQTMKFLLIAVEMVFQNLELQLARHNVSLVQHFLKNFLKENLLKDKEDLLNKMPQLMLLLLMQNSARKIMQSGLLKTQKKLLLWMPNTRQWEAGPKKNGPLTMPNGKLNLLHKMLKLLQWKTGPMMNGPLTMQNRKLLLLDQFKLKPV